jgi:hypothetical protein
MDIITFPPQEASEVSDDVQRPWTSGNEQGRADTADGEAGRVTPGPAHPFSGGILLPESCWQCGGGLNEHRAVLR